LSWRSAKITTGALAVYQAINLFAMAHIREQSSNQPNSQQTTLKITYACAN